MNRSRLSFLVPWIPLVALIAFGSARADEPANGPRQRLLMDFGWRFHLGDQWGLAEKWDKAGQSTGPAAAGFNDASWRRLDLPHDWAIELPFDPGADGNHGFRPVGPNFHTNDVGWYRRTFTLPASDKGRRLWLEFDGVFRDCRVFVNGFRVGHQESGYSSFRYDITDVANCGGENSLAVRVDASQFEGWFYEGAGIYRHVWLVKTAPLAIAPDGNFVYSTFHNNVPEGAATIHFETSLNNSQDKDETATVAWEILDGHGKHVARAGSSIKIPAGTSNTALSETKIHAPLLWSPETPNLYKLVTTVAVGGRVADRTETDFGIRTLAFDPDKGFLLNGRPCTVKGTCNHQDHAGVGSAMPDALQYFRIRRLKEMGGNAVRTSHNAPTPEWLEACDHLGMLVMDENRLLGSDAANLALLQGQILRDRNHPSVFIWSLFNEENHQGTPTGARIAKTMQELVHSLDPTRLCTCAASEGDVFEGVNSVLDVRGWNYNVEAVDSYHAKHPAQPEIGTEQASTLCTRGIYATDPQRGYMSSYDDNGPRWGNTAESWWQVYAVRPWLSGGFVWTGFDYRGEPTPYGWPCINSHFGIMDTCGFPKDNFYYYQSWWSDHPVVHLLPHWNWPGKDGQDIDVRCLSNCEEVELLLNGNSLGRKTMPRNSQLKWSVKYAPGTLLARGFNGGKLIAEEKIETTGAPARLKLMPDRISVRANDEDLSIINVAVTDEQGRVVPLADNRIDFNLTGPGRILGVGNGDPSCHEPDVYIPMQQNRDVALEDWRMERVPDVQNRPEVQESFDDSQWPKADVHLDTGPLNPNESAVFRTRYTASADDLVCETALIAFGSIDDDGWIYVNGQFAGESHDWSTQASMNVLKFLHEGANTIAVAVHNRNGPGGLNKGAMLSFEPKPKPVRWQRSAFNGLAQIIVEAGKDPGVLNLTAQSTGLANTSVNIISAQGQGHELLP